LSLQDILDNIFIIAACNPHRGDSLAMNVAPVQFSSGTCQSITPATIVASDSYYVRKLHSTLSLIKWDYGSLNAKEEEDYIRAKFIMLQKELPTPIEDVYQEELTQLIVQSQEIMREYMRKELLKTYHEKEAKIRSGCCVSQRDIQRVITFYRWLLNSYQHDDHEVCKPSDQHRHALMVSLALVYYMRLPIKYRDEYQKFMDRQEKTLGWQVSFKEALDNQLEWYVKAENLDLPSGIAKTEALKENLLATILCCVTHTPLIIEGAPGTSKTLSFNVAVANLKGKGSRKEIFKRDDLYPCLEPQFYQCSRKTNAEEIKVVFNRAIKVQGHRKESARSFSVVFMDEAGLPEKAHESLKILHYYLEHPTVSFVAITNHPLDAAKTNRAVSVYRPETSSSNMDDLRILARDCLEIKTDVTKKVIQFCTAYQEIMRDSGLSKFYGLRDFIYFLLGLRGKIDPNGSEFSADEKEHIIFALQQNFGGKKAEEFHEICKYFLKDVSAFFCCSFACIFCIHIVGHSC
jgi:hemicentin